MVAETGTEVGGYRDPGAHGDEGKFDGREGGIGEYELKSGFGCGRMKLNWLLGRRDGYKYP